MQQLENLFKQLDNINADYEEKMDKLKAKRDRDTSDMWQRMKHWGEVSHLHLDKDKKRFRCVMNHKKTMANISISYRPSYEVQPTFSMKVDNIITKRGA